MALPTGLKTAGGKAVAVVILVFMALLSFRGISTPSLLAQGEQRRPSFFNIRRDIPGSEWRTTYDMRGSMKHSKRNR
jgi:hypothetical protein